MSGFEQAGELIFRDHGYIGYIPALDDNNFSILYDLIQKFANPALAWVYVV